METASLKSFATWARRALINEVSARITAVLAPSSPERIELPRSVAALEGAVKEAGGADAGRAAVADRVAYTWFNRIIALRFMDANGYNGIGIVSPQEGVEIGQPEILAEAKRGSFDEAVSPAIRQKVSALLDGTRVSSDPQSEAYALLLTEYCRHWHSAMPFMFERAGDFTELLMPANLLADESVLNRAVAVMTKEVCKDVEVIGWLYQFYISELKDQINESRSIVGADQIAPVTQLFTPHWIVRYLVENSLGRMWIRSRPSSQICRQMGYFVKPVAGRYESGATVSSVEDLRVIDPACGSGHMLTYAFDLLYAIYQEEGYAPSSIPELILTRNLRGLEIDGRAAQLAAFALAMKARSRDRRFLQRKIHPEIVCIRPIAFDEDVAAQMANSVSSLSSPAGGAPISPDAIARLLYAFADADTFGSLIRIDIDATAALEMALPALEADTADLYLSAQFTKLRNLVRQAKALASHQYHIVIANPPYLGTRNVGPKLSGFAKKTYPDTKSDLYAMFIERSVELAVPASSVAMVTMHSWMFL